ncbi:winged helix-turn-helix domain-containing protein [Streptomyces kaniharaensis]|uniref:winged helix-turn-helix domain-containing protein n=1 Tax=Streptomyces kaniharaensis TaxID=212423 RepID=UPI002DDD229A|nr:winged helix-turn-helix domain-containing protein [Streptomyces kaniharaensis]
MTEDLTAPTAGALPEHAVRTALLALLAEHGTITSTEAAARLGYSSGLCSFHLRQLARHGLIEEAPPTDGRARPWQLPRPQQTAAADDFGDLARGLEDESYQRWLARRTDAPAEWQHDDAFSAVVHLTPAELTAVGDAVRRILARFRDREHNPGARPAGARPVAAVTRLFPLLPDDQPDRHPDER